MVGHLPFGYQRHEKTLLSRFFHRVAPYQSNGVLPTSNYGTTVKFLHTETVSKSISFLARNSFLHTASPQIPTEEANLPRPHMTTLSQHRSSFCSSLHFYRERMGLIPSSLCPSCCRKPHTSVHIFFCPSHPTPKIEKDLSRLTSEFLCDLLSFIFRLFLLLPLNRLPLTSKRVRGNHHPVF